uniref:Peptidyl-prolyl cis-trans isomerase SurA n=1 Tax=Chlorobium chlorochromatii (strain CaD3) TaxID=340177 RepID=Q3ANT7_CHLCH
MKKNSLKHIVLAGTLLLVAAPHVLRSEVVDRVVAVVGNDAIFQSDINRRAAMLRAQYPDLAKEQSVPRNILQGMVEQKLLVTKARLDSVTVESAQVDATTLERLRQIVARFPTKQAMERQLGMTLPALRESIREELTNQQLADKLRRKKTALASVTYDEVMAFYRDNRGQIAPADEQVSVSQIIKYAAVTPESRKEAAAVMQSIQQELQAGADFGELARKYSQDPGSATSGGDLGFVRKGQLVARFEQVAFALKEGEVSEVVETRYGLHLIQMLNRDDNSIHVRHILRRMERSTDDFKEANSTLASAYESVVSGKESFADAAKRLSDDDVSAARGGQLVAAGASRQTVPLNKLFPQMRSLLGALKVGDVSRPQLIEPPQGEPFYAIFKLNERIPAHPVDPQKDYSVVEELALDAKKEQLFSEWMESLYKEVYVHRVNM